MSLKWWIGSGGAVFVLLVAIGSWFWSTRESAQLVEVKRLQAAMQQKLFAPTDKEKEAAPNERRAMFQQLHEKMEALPEAERQKAAQAMREAFMRQMQEKLKKFFAMSPAEQSAALDKEIDEQEARRKAWGARPFGPPPNGPPGNANAPGGPGASAGTTGSNRPVMGPPGGPGSWRNLTDEQRMQMHRQMVNSTTPEFRAQMTQYMQQMDQRRQARGLAVFKRPF